MKREFWAKKDISKRLLFPKYEVNKLVLKSLVSRSNLTREQKLYLFLIFFRFTKFSSLSYYRRGCNILSSPRSINRFFKLCRYQFKYQASNGYLTGIRKSSF